MLRQIKEAKSEKLSEHEKACWFCKSESPAEKSKWAKQQITKPASSRSYKVKSTYELYMSIPRCDKCYRIHAAKKIYNSIFILTMLAPIVLSAAGIAYPPPILMSVGIGGLVVGTIIYQIIIGKHTKPEKYKLQYPPILELRRQGYKRWWATMFTRDFQ